MSESIQLCASQLQGIALPVNRRDFVDRANLSDLLRLMRANEAITPLSDTQPVALRQVRVGAVLHHEGADAEVLNFVRVGMFKTFTTAEDGYEQVLGFAGRGEVLGFDAIGNARHPTAAVALEDSSVYALRVPEVFALCQRMPAFDRALHLAASCQLARRGELADVMARGRRRSAAGALPRAPGRPHARTRPVAEPLRAAHDAARHRQPSRRGARNGESLVHRAGVMGLPAGEHPRSRHPRHGRPEGVFAQHPGRDRRGPRARAQRGALVAPPGLVCAARGTGVLKG